VWELPGLWNISAGELERLPVKWNGHSHHPLSTPCESPRVAFAVEEAGTPQRLGLLDRPLSPEVGLDFGIY
jgi:hypothetical protein